MRERQIWCAAGKRMVTLPEGAFDQSLEKAGVSITPCKGCAHTQHVHNVKNISDEIVESKKLKIKKVPHLKHDVQVLAYNGKLNVQCTCNCYPEIVKK